MTENNKKMLQALCDNDASVMFESDATFYSIKDYQQQILDGSKKIVAIGFSVYYRGDFVCTLSALFEVKTSNDTLYDDVVRFYEDFDNFDDTYVNDDIDSDVEYFVENQYEDFSYVYDELDEMRDEILDDMKAQVKETLTDVIAEVNA